MTARADTGACVDLEPILRLLAAAGLTALIGIDRELRSKPAGLRTNIVVGIATAAFALAGAEGFAGGDPTRVAAQIVSGIGFLGGGAIFAAGGKPHGLTTAAALWGSAAVGLAAGIGRYDIGVGVVLVTVLALWPLDVLGERVLAPRSRVDVRLHVVMRALDALAEVQQLIDVSDAGLFELRLQPVGGDVIAEMQVSGRQREIQRLVGQLEALEGVRMVGRQAFARRDG